MSKLRILLDNYGKKISEEKLIFFDYKVILLVFICLFIFFFSVVFKLHGSSTAIWNKRIPGEKDPKLGIITGSPKFVRSDEWLYLTPLTLSQTEKGFPQKNESVGAGKSPVVLGLPSNHFSNVFTPQNWAYFLLDKERAFSFYWNYKIIGLFLSFFFLLMILTKNDFLLSLAGSSWLFMSSFIQWWFSISLPEMITSFAIIFISICYLLLSKKKISIILSSIFLLIFSVNFVLFFYPPFQILLFYILMILFLGFIIPNLNWSDFKDFLKLRLTALSSVSLITTFVLFRFYIDTKSTISLMMNTSYPGKRVTTGGGIRKLSYFLGFFDSAFTEESHFKFYGNVSESSNFLFLFPFVGIFIVKDFFLKIKDHLLYWLLFAYILILSVYSFFRIPTIISKLTLLSFIPTQTPRILLGIGMAGIIIVIIYMASDKILNLTNKSLVVILSAVFISVFWYGMFLESKDYILLNFYQIILSTFLITAIIYSLLKKKKAFFFAALFLLLLPNLTVNPLAYGFKPIYKKKIAVFIQKNKEQLKDSKWIVFGDHAKADYLKAIGLTVINGSQFVPNLDNYKILDPDEKNKFIYNRSGHVYFSEAPISKGEKVEFFLSDYDFHEVIINPFSKKLRKLGVSHLAFTYEPGQETKKRLVQVSPPLNNIWLYKFKD